MLKTIKKTIVLLVMLGISILIISVVNISTQTAKITISNETLKDISQINWGDKECLLKMGFIEHENEFYCVDTLNDIPFRIVVSRTKNRLIHSYRYEDIYYSFEENSSIGRLSVKRIWTDKIPVVRRYAVYANGVEISMLEDNIEGSPFLFEDVIAKLKERGENTEGGTSEPSPCV